MHLQNNSKVITPYLINNKINFLSNRGHVHVASDKSTIPKSCQVKFKSFHGRILPNCDKNRGKTCCNLHQLTILGKIILDKLDIRKNGGNVMIYFKNSPNVTSYFNNVLIVMKLGCHNDRLRLSQW